MEGPTVPSGADEEGPKSMDDGGGSHMTARTVFEG